MIRCGAFSDGVVGGHSQVDGGSLAEYLHGRLKHLRRRLNSFVFLLFHLKIENVHQSQKMVKVVSVD